MKRIISTMILLFLILIPAMSGASSLILLKNGGQVVTPFYWFEGRHIFFYYAGGTAGIERKEVAGIRSSEGREKQDTGNVVVWNPGIKDLPPEPPVMKKAQESEKPGEGKEAKVDIEAYRKKKDEMTVKLDGFLEQDRQAAGKADEETRRKIREDIVTVSKQIYKLTDEVTEKNKGKLPDGWWGKQ
jgi:hypothetical protein